MAIWVGVGVFWVDECKRDEKRVVLPLSQSLLLGVVPLLPDLDGLCNCGRQDSVGT